MPMYNFQCEKCGKRFEEIVAYDRRGEVRCPECSGDARVLVSAFAVRGAGSRAAPATGAAPAASRFT